METWDSAGNEIEVPLLGLPEESDWILNSNYSDKTLMRNVISYGLYNKMDRYAPRTRYCELILNGQYWGIYILMEKIKRDNNRVDIDPLLPEDTLGAELTGGYILKIDKITGSGGEGWISPYPPAVAPNGQSILFQHEYPDFELLQPQQINYIQQYTDSFETALYNFGSIVAEDYKDYIDIGSSIDYFILNEISKNIDGYRLSTFFYKDRSGKFVIGPPWDYDIAWHNADYCQAWTYQGWAYQFGNVCPGDTWQVPFWWEKFLTDSVYLAHLKCRWNDLRETLLSDNSLMESIDSIHFLLDESQSRNFQQWPILGIYVWPNPWPIPATYEEEVESLKSWILSRMDWLDMNMPGECITSYGDEVSEGNMIKIFPNPAGNYLNLSFESNFDERLMLTLCDLIGRPLKDLSLKPGIINYQLDLESLSSGVYFLILDFGEYKLTRKLIISSYLKSP